MRYLNRLMMIVFILSGTLLQAEVGSVVAAHGRTYVVDLQKQVRLLSFQSPIQVGDTLTTSIDGTLQLHFQDGAVWALSNRSRLFLKQYPEPTSVPKKSTIVELSEGHLRLTMPADPSNRFVLIASELTIWGEWGAFEVHREGQHIRVGAFQGELKLMLHNEQMTLGPAHSYRFALINLAESTVIGRLHPPEALQQAMSEPFANQALDDADLTNLYRINGQYTPIPWDDDTSRPHRKNQ